MSDYGDHDELARREPDESPGAPMWEEPSYGDPVATDPGDDLEGLPSDPEPGGGGGDHDDG
jgi:hypothetical protein